MAHPGDPHYRGAVLFLALVGLLLVVGAIAVVRHSRMFRGSRSHFEVEDRFRGDVSRSSLIVGGG
jgi:hypothetical protein